MNYDDAKKVAADVEAIGGFSQIEVDHHGFCGAVTEAVKVDGKWRVNLWSFSARGGNRNLYAILSLPRDAKHLGMLVRDAKGKATARDRQALGRIASEKANA